MSLASRHVKVALSGDGCDEIFGGYEDLAIDERRWEVVRTLQNLPAPLLKIALSCSSILPTRQRKRVRRVAQVPLANWYQRDYPTMSRFLNQSQKSSLWPGTDGQDSDRLVAALYQTARSPEPLQQLLSVFQKDWLVEDLLMKADKISMATSLELRTPFLDYRLVEWANRKQKAIKVKRTGLFKYETKSILRRFCSSRLPKEIVTRPKRGFPVPAYQWLSDGLEKWSHDVLLGQDSRLAQAFSRDALRQLLTKASQGAEPETNGVWLLIVLEFWLQVWNANLAGECSGKPAKEKITDHRCCSAPASRRYPWWLLTTSYSISFKRK
jgi:asparagine synthase (glutamine-hydrolysing)